MYTLLRASARALPLITRYLNEICRRYLGLLGEQGGGIPSAIKMRYRIVRVVTARSSCACEMKLVVINRMRGNPKRFLSTTVSTNAYATVTGVERKCRVHRVAFRPILRLDEAIVLLLSNHAVRPAPPSTSSNHFSFGLLSFDSLLVCVYNPTLLCCTFFHSV